MLYPFYKLLIATVIGSLALVAEISAPDAFAQDNHHHHAAQQHRSSQPADSTLAYQKVAADMHKDMDIPYTGNADIDFVRGMIPHHQGAVEMAKVVLKHGKDPEVRALAEKIIAAQNDEIAFMQKWLETQDKP